MLATKNPTLSLSLSMPSQNLTLGVSRCDSLFLALLSISLGVQKGGEGKRDMGEGAEKINK
jgi:hypothetical protein